MGNYGYTDIFASKGIEYLLIIAFLILLILFLRWLTKPEKTVLNVKRLFLVDWFHLAGDYYYHQGHSWVASDKAGFVKVGMDDFSQKLLGKMDSISLPDVGDKVCQGEKGWCLQIDSNNIDMLSPVDGKVVEVNTSVLKDPEIINKDPYYKGWLFKVRMEKHKAGIKNLITGKVAKAWLQETVSKISMLITGNREVVLQDGGMISSGFVRELSPDNWINTARELLLTDDLN
jgi:glycine cleavage system H protein